MYNGHDNQNDGALGNYWNADGYSSERGNKNLVFENCRASGWTDGGHDHKGENITYINCTSWDNKRNFRSWGFGPLNIFYNINSTEPRNRGNIEIQLETFITCTKFFSYPSYRRKWWSITYLS